jgi:hypothetical protein
MRQLPRDAQHTAGGAAQNLFKKDPLLEQHAPAAPPRRRRDTGAMAAASSVGIMGECFFVGRTELLSWINSLLGLNVAKIEAVRAAGRGSPRVRAPRRAAWLVEAARGGCARVARQPGCRHVQCRGMPYSHRR